ncbi:MAG: hypothetical protein ABSB74_04285 [Tepidisphaeraceae bacterium]
MRRGATPCIIDLSNRAVKLTRVDFADKAIGEEFLQIALHANPDLLPVNEIDPDFAPLVSLGREIDGIDNLFISPRGKLAIVETKLWRNPQATREVVAQILDYAGRLSKYDYEDLEQGIRDGLKPTPLDGGRSLHQYVASECPKETLSEEQFHDEVNRTLETGRFLLLVVGDGIHENIEAMLGSLHRHPRSLFSFRMIEMQIYENPMQNGSRIVIPQLVANSLEIVRAVVRVQTTGKAEVSVDIEEKESTPSGGRRRTLSEDEFFEEIEDEATKTTYRRLLKFADEIGAIAVWRASSVSIQFPDPAGSKQNVTLFVLNTGGALYTGWTLQQFDTLNLPENIAIDYVKAVASLVPGVTPKAGYSDVLSRDLKAAEIEKTFDNFIRVVRDFVAKIKSASAASAVSAK